MPQRRDIKSRADEMWVRAEKEWEHGRQSDCRRGRRRHAANAVRNRAARRVGHEPFNTIPPRQQIAQKTMEQGKYIVA